MLTKNTDADPLDVLIVGAGLSGIGAAAILQQRRPGKRYLILEGRDAIGGTWDLFRYPGVRSDSDMYTLGYGFRPWTDPQAIADGAAIRAYVRDTASEHRIEPQIRFGHRVVEASWSSEQALWTVRATLAGGGEQLFRARFLHMCSGYYSYDEAYRPAFEGEQDYRGRIVQPQFWPEDLDYTGKRVLVIGSGATAVTMVPAMAGRAAHVTMLQRSPSYVVSRPARDSCASALALLLPRKLAYALTRWRLIAESMVMYALARGKPELVVMATGLQLKLLGGATILVDGQVLDPSRAMSYKGMMLSDVPNCALSFGYANASWTLKADLTATWVCRLLGYMDRHGMAIAVARRDPQVASAPFLHFTSGYVQRARHLLPIQGARRPWQVYQNYLQDLLTIRFGRIDDGVMHFGPKGVLP